MLNDKEKKEMLADAFDRSQQQTSLKSQQQRAQASRSLDHYIAFLMAVQKIKPFAHKRVVTLADKNIL